MFRRLSLLQDMVESAWVNVGHFLYHLVPDIRKETRKPERLNMKILRKKKKKKKKPHPVIDNKLNKLNIVIDFLSVVVFFFSSNIHKLDSWLPAWKKSVINWNLLRAKENIQSKPCLQRTNIRIIWSGLVEFYGISTLVGYFMPNPLYILYTSFVSELFVDIIILKRAWAHLFAYSSMVSSIAI